MRKLLFPSSLLTIALLFLGPAVSSCKKNKSSLLKPVCSGQTATYNTNIKSIIDARCVSCHSNYNSYSGISSITSNGLFKKHVLTNQDMPQGSQLSQDQINLFQCWADANFPEN